jgi:V-type H+-transporting ATPase subunit a
MGLFAFYNGWIYNEFFAIPMEVFGSCYYEEATIINWASVDSTVVSETYGWRRLPNSTDGTNCVYTFGMDPRWF